MLCYCILSKLLYFCNFTNALLLTLQTNHLTLPHSFSYISLLPSFSLHLFSEVYCFILSSRLVSLHKCRLSPLATQYLCICEAGESSRSAVLFIPATTEMLCLGRIEEFITCSLLFEHVQCVIMLDHLFLLGGRQKVCF